MAGNGGTRRLQQAKPGIAGAQGKVSASWNGLYAVLLGVSENRFAPGPSFHPPSASAPTCATPRASASLPTLPRGQLAEPRAGLLGILPRAKVALHPHPRTRGPRAIPRAGIAALHARHSSCSSTIQPVTHRHPLVEDETATVPQPSSSRQGTSSRYSGCRPSGDRPRHPLRPLRKAVDFSQRMSAGWQKHRDPLVVEPVAVAAHQAGKSGNFRFRVHRRRGNCPVANLVIVARSITATSGAEIRSFLIGRRHIGADDGARVGAGTPIVTISRFSRTFIREGHRRGRAFLPTPGRRSRAGRGICASTASIPRPRPGHGAR